MRYNAFIHRYKSNKSAAESHTQQGRQREPSIKTLRFPLSAEFWSLASIIHRYDIYLFKLFRYRPIDRSIDVYLNYFNTGCLTVDTQTKLLD